MATLRPYEPRDRAAGLALFDGNAPPFFAPPERLDTSQHTRGLFEWVGFAVQDGTPDGYAPGPHRYEMALSLDLGSRERIRQEAEACGAAAAVTGLRVDLLRGTARRPEPTTILLDSEVANAFGVAREATLLPDGLDRRTFRSGNVVLRRLGEQAEEEAR